MPFPLLLTTLMRSAGIVPGLILLERKEARFACANLTTVFDVSESGGMYDGFSGYAQPLEKGDVAAFSL